MSSPLLEPLVQLRRRARRVLLVRGAGLCLATGVAGTTLAIALDWLLHLDNSTHRGLILCGLVLVHIAAAWHWLIAPLMAPLSDLALASRIEQRFPELQDRLASGLQFARDLDDPRVGSPDLKRGVIDSAVEAMAHIDIDAVIEPRTARRAALVASGLVAIGLALVAFKPLEAGTGLGRLYLLSSEQWPRTVDLQFLDPTLAPSAWDGHNGARLPAGESLALQVVNTRGDLPPESVIELRHAKGPLRTRRLLAVQSLEHSTRRDSTHRLRDVGTLLLMPPEGFETLEFRARGGDDATEWIPLSMIPPPLLESLNVVLNPPAYTGRPLERLPTGHGDIEAWIGTRAEITAVVNQPIRSASLVRGDQQPLAVSISDNGRTLKIDFIVETAGVSHWFLALVDRNGLTAERPEQFELRGLVDRVPDVELVEPPGNIQVTPQARMPLAISAHDDVGLADLHLVIRPINTAQATETRLRLHGEHPGEGLLLIEHTWPSADSLLKPGMEFDVHVEATDACDLDPPRVGRSATRTISVVTPSQKRDQLDARQSALLTQLGEILRKQRNLGAQTAVLIVQCETAGRLRPGDRDILLASEVNQQLLDQQLAAVDSGLAQRAQRLLAERDANRIDDPSVTADLKRIAGDLESLRDRELPELEAALAQARRLLDSTPAANPLEILSTIRDHQDRVISVLESIDKDLAPAQDRRDRLAEARRIIEHQQQLLNDTASQPEQTLDQPIGQLTTQQQANLQRMARQQADLADQLQRLLRHTASPPPDILPLKPPDPPDAPASPGPPTSLLPPSHTAVGDQGTSAAMKAAADNIRRNHLGEAQQTQRSILEQLAQFERSLQDHVTSEDQTELARLNRLLAGVKQLVTDQTTLQARTRRALQGSASRSRRSLLKTRQSRLRRDAQQAVDAAGQLELTQAQAIAQGAADAMHRAAVALGQSDSTAAPSAQATAIERLESLHRMLAEQQAKTRARLTTEQSLRAWQDLSQLRTRQDQLVQHTLSLEETRNSTGRWTRPLLKRLGQLLQRQESVVTETRRVEWPVADDNDARRVLDAIALQMQLAADSLRRRETGPRAQQPQQLALAQLDRWLSQTRTTTPRTGTATASPLPGTDPAGPNTPGVSPRDPTGQVTNPGSRPAGQPGIGTGTGIGEVASKVRLNALKQAPWGNLPPELRRRISQSGRERTPARYTELVRRYYESLAGKRARTRSQIRREPRK